MNVLGYGMFGKWIWTSVVCRFCGLYELCVGQCIWMHGLVNAGLGFGMFFLPNLSNLDACKCRYGFGIGQM
jgi:hypothetical protein